MLLNILNTPAAIFECTLFDAKKIQLSVLRLDTIHPVISGNKLFKLHYFLEDAMAAPHKTLLTFGGAYSNHLAATAYACKMAGVKSIAVVRGERPLQLSHTLQHCLEHGMQLHFVSREDYAGKEDEVFLQQLKDQYGPCTIVPEGGYHPAGARGAALIHRLIPAHTYSHICTAAGTATTAAGLLKGASNENIVVVPVLKGMTDIEERIAFCSGPAYKKNSCIFSTIIILAGMQKKHPNCLLL